MGTRRFASLPGLGWTACSLLFATGLVGCNGAGDPESEAVEARSDAVDVCETVTTYFVEYDGESGAECQSTICTQPNGCSWYRLICSDGWDESSAERCYDEPEMECESDLDCPYLSHCDSESGICEY